MIHVARAACPNIVLPESCFMKGGGECKVSIIRMDLFMRIRPKLEVNTEFPFNFTNSQALDAYF